MQFVERYILFEDKSFIILDMMNILIKWQFIYFVVVLLIQQNSNKYSSAEIFKRFANMGLICPKVPRMELSGKYNSALR
jgi:hypothetical protein